MSFVLRDLLARVVHDSWRDATPFSEALTRANDGLWSGSVDGATDALGKWLQAEQPCLFGRIAAQRGLITYCLITEQDVSQGDLHVRDKIQDLRRQWSAEAFKGTRSGFVIALLSQKLAVATPNHDVASLAQRLCELYLLCDIEFDRIYTDKLRLEAPTHDRPTWEWEVGVNYFSSHADGRWWQDHRIPGGIAFSMNSVGHMVKSTAVAQSTNELLSRLGLTDSDLPDAKLDSLSKALRLAMMTINRAYVASSGPATWLLPAGSPADSPPCPIELAKEIAGKNHCQYGGYYHTDVTLPTLYFKPDVQRPPEVASISLDFTYLFDDSIENPDHLRMGEGVHVRAPGASVADSWTPSPRWRKAHAIEVKD